MFSAEILKFFTKKERIERENNYKNKIFQLGDGHKELVQQMLEHIFTEKSRKHKEKMFAYISLKQILIESNETTPERLKAWSSKAYYLPEDKIKVLALVMLDKDLLFIDDFPCVESVIARAKELAVQKIF